MVIRLVRKLVEFMIAVAIIVIVFLIGAAIYLSPQDKLEKSDAIVVISGGDTDQRINEGIKLYKDGYSEKLIFSGAAAEGNVSNARAMKNIAVKEGVPAKNILIEEESKTTEENASMSAKIITASGIKSIILVTSPYHQRRAYESFRTSLGKDFKIINHSAADKDWRKAGWWSNEQARFLTLGEILKNIYSLFK